MGAAIATARRRPVPVAFVRVLVLAHQRRLVRLAGGYVRRPTGRRQRAGAPVLTGVDVGGVVALGAAPWVVSRRSRMVAGGGRDDNGRGSLAGYRELRAEVVHALLTKSADAPVWVFLKGRNVRLAFRLPRYRASRLGGDDGLVLLGVLEARRLPSPFVEPSDGQAGCAVTGRLCDVSTVPANQTLFSGICLPPFAKLPTLGDARLTSARADRFRYSAFR